jgi:carbonic anhydrase
MAKNPLGVTRNAHFNLRLKKIESADDIPQRWQGTPIASFIAAHNFDMPVEPSGKPELLIATCIEFRFTPKIPSMYAYVIRRASGRLIGSEFAMVYTMSQGVKHVVLIGHDDCGMTKVSQKRAAMIETLKEQGWSEQRAEEYVAAEAGRYAIEDEVDSLESEFYRLLELFPNIEIAPLFVSLNSHRMYLPSWYLKFLSSAGVSNQSVSEVSQ